ncbi:MAG TPA: hypothetical protein VD758_07340 [Gemmatimonadaceae bacterium]|nr:hypothetical protein [Gemmatimonadaceae bacterium]
MLSETACFSSLDQQHWWEALRVQPLTEGQSQTYSADLMIRSPRYLLRRPKHGSISALIVSRRL